MNERDDDPFRSGPVAPAALRDLAARAPGRVRALPRGAKSLPDLRLRVRAALGETRPLVRTSIYTAVLGVLMVIGAIGNGEAVQGLAYALIFALIGGSVDYGKWIRAGSRVTRQLEAGARWPFPVAGYELSLASERPLFDVHLRGAAVRDVVVDAAAALDTAARIEWIDDRVFRVSMPAVAVGRARHVIQGGDAGRWRTFAERILVPLHEDIGIERVEMGGAMRALLPGSTVG